MSVFKKMTPPDPFWCYDPEPDPSPSKSWLAAAPLSTSSLLTSFPVDVFLAILLMQFSSSTVSLVLNQIIDYCNSILWNRGIGYQFNKVQSHVNMLNANREISFTVL